jgi:hypothetical protein
MSEYLKASKADVKWLKQHGSKATTRAYSAVVNLTLHVQEHNDWTYINEITPMIRECKLGIEKFQVWTALVFKGLKYDDESKLWVRKSKKASVTIDLDVLAEHWDDYVKVVTFVPNFDSMFNLPAMLSAQQKRLDKALDAAEETTGDYNAMLDRKAKLEALA